MLFRTTLAVLLLIMSNSIFARSFEINLSDESAQLKYGMLIGATTYGRTEVVTGFLFNENDDVLAEIALTVKDEAGSKSPGLEIGVGPKFYGGQSDTYSDGDIAAMAIGGQLRYKNINLPRLVFGIVGYFAPSIVSFMDTENMHEFSLQLEYEILPTANVFLGYRNIEVDLKQGGDNLVVDDTTHFGLRLQF